jgi:hypothetical protein
MSDKIFNFISVLCFGCPLASSNSGQKLNVWEYETGIEFFATFFLTDMPSGEVVDYSHIFHNFSSLGRMSHGWTYGP